MKKKSLARLALIFLILSPILSQNGDGGGGGGDGGSSQHEGRQTCKQKCKEDNACIEKCVSWGKVQIILLGIFGGCLVIIFMYCAIAGICYCCTPTYKRLEYNYNVRDRGKMRLDEFQRKKQKILSIFEQLKNSDEKKFFFVQKRVDNRVEIALDIVRQKELLTEVKLTGKDKFGTWKARGFITCRTNCSVFLWFFKTYDDQIKADQTGRWSNQVYESTKVLDDNISGKWFCAGYENNQSHSGTWRTEGVGRTNLSMQSIMREDIIAQN